MGRRSIGNKHQQMMRFGSLHWKMLDTIAKDLGISKNEVVRVLLEDRCKSHGIDNPELRKLAEQIKKE